MATATIDRHTAHDDVEASLITTRVWRSGERPVVVELDDVRPGEGVIHFDVLSGTDPHLVYRALRPLCGAGLTLEAVEDLVQPDEMPQIKPQQDARLRAVSAFGVEASADRLVFNVVEFLANERWLLTCSHTAASYAGSGPAETHASTHACSHLVRDVADRWSTGSWESAGDLGVLFLHALTCSYGTAMRDLTSRLDEWERLFYGEPDVDQHALRDLRGLASEFRARLNGLNVPRDEAQTAWFSGVTEPSIAERADRHIDCALAGLDRFGDMLRGSFALLQANAAQTQQQQAERLQRNVELVTVVFLVPTLIAGAWGENTWVPGQGKPWGFALTLATMVIGALLARAWLRARRDKMLEVRR